MNVPSKEIKTERFFNMGVQGNMRNYFFSILLVFLNTIAFSQQGGSPSYPMNKKGMEATSLKYPLQISSHAYYESVIFWEDAIASNKSDAAAWFNYYLLTSRSNAIQPDLIQKKCGEIIDKAKSSISGKYQFSLMRYIHSLNEMNTGNPQPDSTALWSAFELAQEKKEIYPYLIQFAIIRQHKNLLQTYCREYEDLNKMSSSLMAYHSNVLRSANTNASIYAKGLNDLVPMAIVQEVYAIRTDVQLHYYPKNGTVLLPNSFLCLSLGSDILNRYPQGRLQGLLIKVDGDTKMSQLQNILFDKLDWSFINIRPDGGSLETVLAKHYLPSLLLLHQYLLKTKDERQIQTRIWLDAVGNYTGETKLIQKALSHLHD
jgi:hypothetical protein